MLVATWCFIEFSLTKWSHSHSSKKRMRDEMPQNQGELDATLLVEGKKEHLINNLASSWIYEKLVTNVGLSNKITDTKIAYSHLYSTSSLLPAQDANFQKSPNKLATKTLTCDTDRTKARTPKCRPAFGCSRRALPGPKKKNRPRLNRWFLLLLEIVFKLQKWP